MSRRAVLDHAEERAGEDGEDVDQVGRRSGNGGAPSLAAQPPYVSGNAQGSRGAREAALVLRQAQATGRFAKVQEGGYLVLSGLS